MNSWEFRDPLFLLMALAAPFAFWAASRSTSALRYSSLNLVDRAPKSWRVRFRKLPALLMAVAVALLAVALAGPRTPDAETKVSREGHRHHDGNGPLRINAGPRPSSKTT